jgi:hypothetical protein
MLLFGSKIIEDTIHINETIFQWVLHALNFSSNCLDQLYDSGPFGQFLNTLIDFQGERKALFTKWLLVMSDLLNVFHTAHD